jgi:hypothetical protein
VVSCIWLTVQCSFVFTPGPMSEHLVFAVKITHLYWYDMSLGQNLRNMTQVYLASTMKISWHCYVFGPYFWDFRVFNARFRVLDTQYNVLSFWPPVQCPNIWFLLSKSNISIDMIWVWVKFLKIWPKDIGIQNENII